MNLVMSSFQITDLRFLAFSETEARRTTKIAKILLLSKPLESLEKNGKRQGTP